MARRKKFPNQIVVRRESGTDGTSWLQTHATVEAAMDADTSVGVDVELGIYELRETRIARTNVTTVTRVKS